MSSTTPSVAELVAMVANLAQTLADLEQARATIPAQRPMPERVLLTVEEAGQRLNIGKTKMYELVKSGEIESVLIGRLRRVHVDAVSAYAKRVIEEQNSNTSAAA